MDEYMLTAESETTAAKPVGDTQVREMMETLRKYRAGKSLLDRRIRSAEEWWRLRNQNEAQKEGHARHNGFKSKSGWLHNVIQSKHADAMDAFPEPNILPREAGDRAEAQKLSAIIPCILEQNKFERTYSREWYSKLKFGTAVYKVIWDPTKLGGMGDISVLRGNLLSLFWEPGIEDIQDSQYIFEVLYYDEDALRTEFPQLGDTALPHDRVADVFPEERAGDGMADKVPVISCYYHRGGLLHMAQFLPDRLLFASENEEELSQTGLYAHGKYPYVFDPLFPIEKSPAGYGFVDLCKQPQMEIDLIKSAMVENTKAGAKPRYFYSEGCGVNREQFMNLDEPLVRVDGAINELQLQPIQHNTLDGNYLAFYQETIQELRETSGNSDAAAGTTPSGVTAASAIAALQEASGKTSRDASMSGYDAYSDVVELVIELVRQFYDLPRQFRIVGEMGQELFTSYDNTGLQPREVADGFMRTPAFDIRIVPQKRSAYTKMANNELALQLYGMGFFDPQRSDQSLAALNMMDYDGREDTIRTVQRNGTMFEQLQMLLQWAQALCAKHRDGEAMAQLQGIMQKTGAAAAPPEQSAGRVDLDVGGEPAHMRNARQTARGATTPTEGGGVE